MNHPEEKKDLTARIIPSAAFCISFAFLAALREKIVRGTHPASPVKQTTILRRSADPLIKDGMLEGWTMAKVLSYGPGNFPQPEVYLSKSYIINHLKEFENGVSFLCPLEAVKKYANLLGRVDGVYVMPKAKMDELMKQTKGDVQIIEDALAAARKLVNQKDVPSRCDKCR